MNKVLTASAAAVALAGMTLGAAAPAEARHYRGYGYHGGHGYHGGYYRGRGDRTALALGAGFLGLAAGAAIASSGNNRGYYDYGYAPRYYDGGYSYGGYAYDDPYVYDRGPVCRTDWRWDRYARRYARVEYCD